MKVVVFINSLGLGGTEKAACEWARGLKGRGHEVSFLTLKDGPRQAELDSAGIPTLLMPRDAIPIADTLRSLKPDVIHTHAPGSPGVGDILGGALAKLPKIPVVQTNIFGRLDNPPEEAWTDFRLFISWTSCVQAAQRAFYKLDRTFFDRASVAVYPLEPVDGPSRMEIDNFRQAIGVERDEVLFGRLSRPEPNKWTDLPIEAFRMALRKNPRMKLLLREPPPTVAEKLRIGPDRNRFLILPTTGNPDELRLTMSSLDVVLHTSSIGESFGYGIAEPMNYGKAVIANSVPWGDQAQIELVRHRECGFIATTPEMMCDAILLLAADEGLRRAMGTAAQLHIRCLANPTESLNRLESALRTSIEGKSNPLAMEDLCRARSAASWLEAHQFGHTWKEQLALRSFHYRVRFHQWRKAIGCNKHYL